MANQDAHSANTAEMREVASAFAEALRKFDAEYGGARRPTAEKFARERFVKACGGKVGDPRFAAEAPQFAYRLLLDEHALFNSYAA